jgi:Zn-dependent protease with chaperone function
MESPILDGMRGAGLAKRLIGSVPWANQQKKQTHFPFGCMGDFGIGGLAAMPTKASSIAALAGILCLATTLAAGARTPAVSVLVNLQTNGDTTIHVPFHEAELAPVLGEVLHCQGRLSPKSDYGEFRCSRALRRNGLSLEATIDIAPIARQLAASDEIQLWINYPRLGFGTTSIPMTNVGGWTRAAGMVQFAAGAVPPPIHVQFGYRSGQLPAVFLPLAGLALALILIATILSRADLANLNLSVFVLGTVLWMGVASQLHAGELLRIMLFGSVWANIAAVLVAVLPPLACVAAGVALGSEKRDGRSASGMFGEVFWGYGIILLPLICAIGALPSMMAGDWMGAAPWLVAVPVVFIGARLGMRAGAGGRVRQISGGELAERVLAMAARMGRRRVKLFILFSRRTQTANAFALPGRSIFFTAPLIRTFSKREVLAVAAHELSHFNHRSGRPWAALCVAMVMFQTPLGEVLPPGVGWLCVALLLPFAIYFGMLRGARQREFVADAGAVALTGDARAMISVLARISRTNKRPLEMNAAAEWFSTHPSTNKRIRALAALGGLQKAELETLCSQDDPGEPYALPAQEGGALFTPAWQTANGGIYSWMVLFTACGAGLTMAWLINRYAGSGIAQLLVGMVLGCVITKCLAATVMSSNYARLGRKLATKLGVSGQLVGLAADGEPLLYKGYRFHDAGLLWFEGGRLCYRSESTSIALNPADVVEVGMVAASPSTWLRLEPRVRFRVPGFEDVKAIILHTVDWLPTQRRLLRTIEQWRATQTSAESTAITGLNAVAGQPFRNPSVAAVVRAFLISGGATLVAGLFGVWLLRAPWWTVWYALAIAACIHFFMFLPAMLYRTPAASGSQPGAA